MKKAAYAQSGSQLANFVYKSNTILGKSNPPPELSLKQSYFRYN